MSPNRRTLKDGSVKISAWCSCGASYKGTARPHWIAEKTYAEWRSLHDAPGHHLVDSKTAARARRRMEATL